MATVKLSGDKLKLYLVVAQKQRARQLEKFEQMYGPGSPATKAAEAELDELGAAIAGVKD